MILTLAGDQILVFLALWTLLCLLCLAIGAVSGYMRGYDRLADDAALFPRPCLACEAAELGQADTVTFTAIPMDVIEEALTIAQREQAAICSTDLGLQARYLEIEIEQMIESADRQIGRFQ